MTINTQFWTDNIDTQDIETLIPSLCDAFSQFPFMLHNKLIIEIGNTGRIECVAEMNQHLVGNVLYGILHGGVTATMLDSIGGLQIMVGLCRQSQEKIGNSHDKLDNNKIKLTEQVMKKVSRVATTDFRVDYLAVGKGSRFIATAEVIRLGSRHATSQMRLVNETGKLIAIATGSYAY